MSTYVISGVNDVIQGYLNLLTPIIILIIISILLGLAIDRVSRDRVIKLFRGYWVVLFYEDLDKNGLKEAYFGRIKIPPRSGGGFELEYPLKTVVNPIRLIAYLKKAYIETGDEKYISKARELYNHLRKLGKIDIEFDDIKYNPFTEPTEASRKVFKNNIKDIYAIIRFIDHMDPNQLERRNRELKKIFHPNIIYRINRGISNFLGLAKDRLSEAIGLVTSGVSKMVSIPIEKEVKKTGEAMLSGRVGSYEALLETSIGKLVILKVKDIDDVERYYQGILREYSPNYIAVYNVDFMIREEAAYIGEKLLDTYPREKLDYHGWILSEDEHIKITDIKIFDGKTKVTLKNIYSDYILIDKIFIGGSEIKLKTRHLEPGGTIDIIVDKEFKKEDLETRIEYTIVKKSDIIWPTTRVKVLGSGEPPEGLIDILIERIKHIT